MEGRGFILAILAKQVYPTSLREGVGGRGGGGGGRCGRNKKKKKKKDRGLIVIPKKTVLYLFSR